MQILSEEQIMDAIQAGEHFEAQLRDGSLSLVIEQYIPCVATAIYAGHHLRADIAEKIDLSREQRLAGESPASEKLLAKFPIRLLSHDSRYEYDLGQPASRCLSGSALLLQPLNRDQRGFALNRHGAFYRILQCLLLALEQRFAGSIVVDMQSFASKNTAAPLLSIASDKIDLRKHSQILDSVQATLQQQVQSLTAREVVRDHLPVKTSQLASFIRKSSTNNLLLPLAVARDMLLESDDDVGIRILQEAIAKAVLQILPQFRKKLQALARRRAVIRERLTANIEPMALKVDQALARLAKNIDTLSIVTPTNIQQEKQRFLARSDYQPNFTYRQLYIDPYSFREHLYRLPVSQIEDPLLRNLYRDVIDSLANRVDLTAKVGSQQFLYNSLRYYGEPADRDISNAKFLLHAAAVPNMDIGEANIDAKAAKVMFVAAAKQMGLKCKVASSSNLVAKALVDNQRKTLLVNRNAMFTPMDVNALIHHELGVHMVTTMNAQQQPLSVFKLGLPGNTYSQEGLAILSEYLSGNLHLPRLQQLSLRVLAVNMMCKGKSFRQVYQQLRDEYMLGTEAAFSLCTRVFRGGGFTKDYLYLSGFRDLLALYGQRDLSSMLVGKTSVAYLDSLDSLIAQGVILPPKYRMPALDNKVAVNPALDYLINSIR